MKKGKKYIAATGLYDKNKIYTLKEAVTLLPKISTSKFEGKAELHVRLNLTEAEKKQLFSGTISFPNSFGAEQKVLVLAEEKAAEEAKAAGADYAGLKDFITKIQKGWLDVDIIIATPKVMPQIAMLGKILGPKGLMPNPKNGTVTTDVQTIVKEYKKGKTNFKSDKQGIVHAAVANLSLETKKVEENTIAFLKAVIIACKKNPRTGFVSISLSPTMGPAIKIDVEDIIEQLT